MRSRKHKIVSVDKGSAADISGIVPGDLLLELNGKPVIDVFDYRTGITEEHIELTIGHADGAAEVYVIEKDEYEDPGLVFESYLMDREKACRNKCIFCFVDQLPKGARKSLRFKDDDLRLSFLTGNFVTLTNITDVELDRLISFKLSPMNISVHTTDPELRVKMLGNPGAGMIMCQLKRISVAGIKMNTQIVLCPGINDGDALARTLDDLSGFGESMLSIVVVPVGLTKYRMSKEPDGVRPFSRQEAVKVVEDVAERQKQNLSAYGRRLIFAADEMYIKAGIEIPAASDYEDFYQLENGVGIVALFVDDMKKGIRRRMRNKLKKLKSTEAGSARKIVLVTGKDAAPFIQGFAGELSELYNADFRVLPVANRFFGETVTVAGLVTGADILQILADQRIDPEWLVVVPDIMLRDSGDRFLDDMTVGEFVSASERNVVFVPPDGKGFLAALDKCLI